MPGKRSRIENGCPHGNLLFVEDLRDCLGIGLNAGSVSTTPESATASLEVLMVGHDLEAEFKSMKDHGIHEKFFHYSGCVDTHVIAEDTRRDMPKGLSGLMEWYNLAECESLKPACQNAKRVFVGAHNAGNDAIATLKVAIAQALDMTLRSQYCEASEGTSSLPEDWYNKPLRGMNKNLLLLAYDSENAENDRYKPAVKNRTTEHGFAWWYAADCIDTVPPGLHGVNWHAYIQARHWINKAFLRYENQKFLVGNSKGFWKDYGRSQTYDVGEGPAPFHALFEELAAKRSIAKPVLQSIESKTPAHKTGSHSRLASGVSIPEENGNMQDIRGLEKLPAALIGTNVVSNMDANPPLAGSDAKTRASVSTKGSPSQRGRTGSVRGPPSKDGSSGNGSAPSRGGAPSRGRPWPKREQPKQEDVLNGDTTTASSLVPAFDDMTLTTSTTTVQSTILTTNGVTVSTSTETNTRATITWAQVASVHDKTKTSSTSQV